MNTNNIFERIREQLSEMAGSTQEHQRLLGAAQTDGGQIWNQPAYRLTRIYYCAGYTDENEGQEKSLQPE